MTAPDDLAARVLAAIADVERIAHATAPPGGWLRWQVRGDGADRNSTTRDDRHPERIDDVAGVPIAAVSAAVGQHLVRHDPKTVLRRCAADRKLIADVQGWPHLTVGDTWYSCAQAIDDWEKDAAPGSACADEDRAGQPCDCGLVDRQRTVLMALAVGYGVLEPTEAS